MPLDLTQLEGLDLGATLEQYLGVWAIDEASFLTLFQRVEQMDLRGHVLAQDADRRQAAAGATVRRTDGPRAVAVIDIQGAMTKRGSSMSDAGSMTRIRRELRQAVADEDVAAVILRIESPGGTISGTMDLAADVRKANQQKPVVAFVEDLCASAGYWVASQAERIIANNDSALVGSIGTFIGLYDLSGLAAQKGIRPIVVRSGAMKGAGFPGTEISQEIRDELQSKVDQTQALFTAGVAEGRTLSVDTVTALADGRMHLAPVAKDLKLIDSVNDFASAVSEALDLAAARARGRASTRRSTMSDPTTPSAASIAELKAAFPNDAQFALDAAEKGLTLIEAKAAYADTLAARLQNRDAELAQARKEQQEAAAKATTPGRGAAAVPEGETATVADGGSTGDPIAEWNAALDAKVQARIPRARAVSQLVKAKPDLHQRYVAAWNEANGRRVG